MHICVTLNQDTGEFCFVSLTSEMETRRQEERTRGLQPLNEKCVVIFGYLAV